jgi:hypothetical protein
MVRMIAPADVLYDRIDLDGIDLARSKSQCVGEIISRACTDDEHVVKRSASAVFLQ